MKAEHWHSLDVDAALGAVESSPLGLTSEEASARLLRHGTNTLSERRGPSWVRKLGEQFVQPLVVVLLFASALSVYLGDHVDAAVIASVVLVNGVIGFFQEYRAERSIAALSKTILTEATALRDGHLRRLPSEQLVVGDVVALQSGDTVPADVRLLSVKDLRVEEAGLTGESVASEKRLGTLPPDTGIGDRDNMAFAGSLVTYGVARGVVVATGDATEMGRIAGLMVATATLQTPLTRRIAGLSRLLVWVILGLAASLVLIEAVRGGNLEDTFNAAVAMAVGAIPEGLPAAVTILLAVGVSAMARRGALIRKLPAVETLGSTTVICSDKTGTLTENQMTVTLLVADEQSIEFTGVGFSEDGDLRNADRPFDVRQSHAVQEALRCGALCNDTRVVRSGGETKVEGDPTEAALSIAAVKAGLDDQALAAFARLDVVPFESEHMYMATLNDSPEGPTLYVKGSSDALFDRCVDALRRDGTRGAFDKARAQQRVEELAASGLRVLVVARRSLPGRREASHGDVEQLSFLGLVGMIDPPRAEAKTAVAECQNAGIRVKMITGDHAVTAAAIADQLGLVGARDDNGKLRAITGTELSRVTPDQLGQLAEEVAVFARVAPEQKLSLVRALQARGHVVAMTGDGVNDAPALKQADIGVAMGKNGTDVARSASAMILTDDNFATIAAAVREGRGIYDNLVKFITWTLPTNGGEGLVLLAAVAFGTALPVLPVQLLWVNLATALLLGTTLIFEPHEPGLMQRPPRRAGAPILDRALGVRTLVVSFAVGGAAFACFNWALESGLAQAQARTIAVNTIVVLEVGYLFACRSLRFPTVRLGWFTNPGVWLGAVAMLGVQLAFTYVPFMNVLFHTAPIELRWWVIISILGALVFLLAELQKFVALRRHA